MKRGLPTAMQTTLNFASECWIFMMEKQVKGWLLSAIQMALFAMAAGSLPLSAAADENQGDETQGTACFQIGSFGLTAANRWRGQLEAAGVKAWLSDERHRGWQGTWIVIPTANIKDRIALVEQLESVGIREWQLLTKGDHAGWISVGIFDKSEGVDRRLKQLEPLDREVMLEPRFKGKGRYDVHFQLDEQQLAALEFDSGPEKIPCSGSEAVAEENDDRLGTFSAE